MEEREGEREKEGRGGEERGGEGRGGERRDQGGEGKGRSRGLAEVCCSLVQHWRADGPAGGEVRVANCPLCDVMMSDGSGLVPQCMAQEMLLRRRSRGGSSMLNTTIILHYLLRVVSCQHFTEHCKVNLSFFIGKEEPGGILVAL